MGSPCFKRPDSAGGANQGEICHSRSLSHLLTMLSGRQKNRPSRAEKVTVPNILKKRYLPLTKGGMILPGPQGHAGQFSSLRKGGTPGLTRRTSLGSISQPIFSKAANQQSFRLSFHPELYSPRHSGFKFLFSPKKQVTPGPGGPGRRGRSAPPL